MYLTYLQRHLSFHKPVHHRLMHWLVGAISILLYPFYPLDLLPQRSIAGGHWATDKGCVPVLCTRACLNLNVTLVNEALSGSCVEDEAGSTKGPQSVLDVWEGTLVLGKPRSRSALWSGDEGETDSVNCHRELVLVRSELNFFYCVFVFDMYFYIRHLKGRERSPLPTGPS